MDATNGGKPNREDCGDHDSAVADVYTCNSSEWSTSPGSMVFMGPQCQQQVFGMYPPQQVPGIYPPQQVPGMTGLPGCTSPMSQMYTRGSTQVTGYPSPTPPPPTHGHMQGWSQPNCCGVNNSASDDQSTARLVRLESALSALKPQIEALLTAQARVQPQAPPPSLSVPPVPAPAVVPQRPAASVVAEESQTIPAPQAQSVPVQSQHHPAPHQPCNKYFRHLPAAWVYWIHMRGRMS